MDSSRGGVEKPLNQQGVMEKQNNVGSSQPAAKTTTYTCEDAKKKLDEYFKKGNSDFKEFAFKKFAKVYKRKLDSNIVPHSDIVKNSFQCMYNVADKLLSVGITFEEEDVEEEDGKDKADWKDIHIELTPDEVMDAIARVDRLGLSNDENKAYKLYGELGDVIFSKMNEAVQDVNFDNNRAALENCLLANRDICKSILSLPLVNFDKGMTLCTRMIDSAFTGELSVFKLPKQVSKGIKALRHRIFVNDFKKLGMFFAFKNAKLAREILPAAQFATSVGMKMPLFMAEMAAPKDSKIATAGLSGDIVGVAVRDNVVSAKDAKGFSLARSTFYHEITHHARSAVGAMHFDESISRKNLEEKIFEDNANLVDAIKDQISDYALTDSEEYMAEFSALVLCCLEPKETEQGKIEPNANPFDYIKDERLWRLYYEFGGPDFAPIIQQKGFLPAGYAEGRNILSDKGCDWCSGYPSKFGIDINQIKDQQVKVEGMTVIGQRSFVKIDEKTILPPPPLGYCYTTENGRLQLKIDKSIDVLKGSTDNKLYDPVFCRLTDGPLTLMKTEPQWIHHFEVLKK